MTNPVETALRGTRIVVVGGGSGIGKAVARQAAGLGATVTIASRSADKLTAAAAEIGPAVTPAPVDMTDADAVTAWAQGLGPVDHLVITASSAARGPFAELPTADLRGMFDAKFFGPYLVARQVLPHLAGGGSVTLFSGALSRRPGAGTSGLAAVNAAVEALGRGLAVELGARARVNTLSPGMVRSDAYAGMPEDQREAMFAGVGSSLPVGRVGTVEEIASAVIMAMSNGFITGTVLDIDGGHLIA